ncbi:MAG: MotA/TolQ/ExbB proton channel family protein [Proteobacteria bacterium]|nr:MotA/TolQ/ExbB proton channel family protein [Pseudomonadota bacterium]
MFHYKTNYSRNVLFQFLILSIFVGFLLLINVDFLLDLYIKNQATNTGYIVNGSILGLFALGLFRLVSLLLRYSREEVALKRFIENVQNDETRPTERISKKSLIYNRYIAVLEISKHNVAVNHSALASTQVATESTRLSLPRFISNILILTGVFGTIISLSIALLGASDIIDSADGISGMSIVIHGMSTALSTTATAIICYLFFGYFYMKLTDVQTELLSGIEQATTLYIMPRFTYQTDSMLHEVGNLVKALHAAANSMAQTQVDFSEAGRNLNTLTGTYADRLTRLNADIEEIKSLLRDGFRLSDHQ